MIQLLNYIIEKGKKSLIQHELKLNFYLSPSLVVCSVLLSCFCTAHVSQTPKCVEAITSPLLLLCPFILTFLSVLWTLQVNYYYFWLIITIPKPGDLFSFRHLLISHTNNKDTDLSHALVMNTITNACIPFRCIIAMTLLAAERTEMQQMKQQNVSVCSAW